MDSFNARTPATRAVAIPVSTRSSAHLDKTSLLAAELVVPKNATGIVVFAHGSGSSRHSPRNQFMARVMREAGLGTLLFDLLTPAEAQVDAVTAHLRFDIPFLADRLIRAYQWLRKTPDGADLDVGFFGASTGAAAALVAAAELGGSVGAIVSRGGRPDLAAEALKQVVSPTLLVVGAHDLQVLELNENAFAQLRCEKRLEIVPNATHLFVEPGTLERAATLASNWYSRFLGCAEP